MMCSGLAVTFFAWSWTVFVWFFSFCSHANREQGFQLRPLVSSATMCAILPLSPTTRTVTPSVVSEIRSPVQASGIVAVHQYLQQHVLTFVGSVLLSLPMCAYRAEDYWIGYKFFCFAYYSNSQQHEAEFEHSKLG